MIRELDYRLGERTNTGEPPTVDDRITEQSTAAASKNVDDCDDRTKLLAVLFWAEGWVDDARVFGNVRAGDFSKALRAALANAEPVNHAPVIVGEQTIATLRKGLAVEFDNGSALIPASDLAAMAPSQQAVDELQAANDRLTDENSDLRNEPWPAWATAVLKVIRSHSGYDGFDDATDGVDLPAELDEHLSVMQADNERLQTRAKSAEAQVAQLREALEPFATVSEMWVDDGGWTELACKNDRIVDWFGATDFLRARTALTAHVQDVAVPDGWQLVPKEPTPEMLKAVWSLHQSNGRDVANVIYEALLDAAPAKPGSAE